VALIVLIPSVIADDTEDYSGTRPTGRFEIREELEGVG